MSLFFFFQKGEQQFVKVSGYFRKDASVDELILELHT